MKKTYVRRILIVLLSIVFVVSAGMLIYQNFQYQQGDKEYAEAEQLAGLPELPELPPISVPDGSGSGSGDGSGEGEAWVDPYADAFNDMDFAALREVNSDVMGWILVPGTGISYPLLRAPNNTYYLNHTWQGSWNSVGAIFLESTNRKDLTDFNTIVYGHRMNNQSMFGLLHNFQNQSYYQQHPYVYIIDDNGSHMYEIFAAYEVSVAGDTYRLGFPTHQSRQEFINYCLSRSVIRTGLVPHTYDKVLTMSTCTGHGHATRWVVQAVQRGVPGSEPPDQIVPKPVKPAQPETPDTSEAPAGSGTPADGDTALAPGGSQTVQPEAPEGPAASEEPPAQEPPTEEPVQPEAPPAQETTPQEPAAPVQPEEPPAGDGADAPADNG